MDPQRRLVALWLCRVRALLGLKLLVFPRLVTKVFLGTPTPVTTAAVRMVGVRDVALGLGAIAGVREGDPGPRMDGLGRGRRRRRRARAARHARPARSGPGSSACSRPAPRSVGMKLAWELADERAAEEIDARHAARLVTADEF